MASFSDSRVLPKVLIADDEPEIIEYIIDLIGERFDFRPITARSGVEARGLLGEHPDVALITTDVSMPNGNGVDFVKAARQANCRAPIVVVSSFSHDVKPQIADLQPIDFLDKLQIGKQLLTTVETLCPEFRRLRDESLLLNAKLANAIESSLVSVNETLALTELTNEQIKKTRLLLKK